MLNFNKDIAILRGAFIFVSFIFWFFRSNILISVYTVVHFQHFILTYTYEKYLFCAVACFFYRVS